MIPLLDGIEKLLPTKVIENAYEDLASAPAKELSKVGVDIVKTARLFLAPIQLVAAFQDRFERMVDRIRNKVPEVRYQEAPPEVAGPAIQQMQYLDDTTVLWEMFEELLTSSIDVEAIAKVHPSFVHILSQLSRDEAVIVYHLRDRDFSIVDTLDLNREQNRFHNLQVEESNVPASELLQPNKVGLYYSHLSSLNLVEWPVEKQDPIFNAERLQTGIRRYSKMRLTEYGRLFVSACVPTTGFQNL